METSPLLGEHPRRRYLTIGALLLICLPETIPAHQLDPKRPNLRRDSRKQALSFCLLCGVNGGFVGSIGPSLYALQQNTGLGEAALGEVVMMNRLTKFLGVFIWTAIARRIQRDEMNISQARTILIASTFTAASCALALYTLRSSRVALVVSMACVGLAYGVADTAVTQLTLWTHTEAREQRTQIALLNAAFTVGCALAPAVVALSLHLGSSCYLSFGVLACVALLSAGILWQAPFILSEQFTHSASSKAEEGARAETQAAASAQTTAPLARAPRRGLVVKVNDRTRANVVVAAMGLVLFCVTGCEHALGTWLPTFGGRVGGIEPASMAVMSSAYWATICAGRVAWAGISTAISSGWPVLVADAASMLASAAFFARFSSVAPASSRNDASTLWAGTLLLALGFASSLPCALTLPAEANVKITPARLLALNIAGSAGEMLCPFLLGIAFEHRLFGALSYGTGALQIIILFSTLVAWLVRG